MRSRKPEDPGRLRHCPYCDSALKFLETVDEKIDHYFCECCDSPVYHNRITGAFYNYIPFHLL